MRGMKALTALSAVTLLAATTAWAGGAACAGKSTDASASTAAHSCPSGAKSASAAGHHCEGMSSEAMAKACTVGKNQVMYSFAVPTAECSHCVEGIQKALMAQAGIHCAHVDLDKRVAYVIADQKMSTKALSKAMAAAGYKNSYRGEGAKYQAEFAKAMASSTSKDGVSCCSRNKEKV